MGPKGHWIRKALHSDDKGFLYPTEVSQFSSERYHGNQKPRKATKLHLKINLIQEIYWEGKAGGGGGMPASAWERSSKEMKRRALYRVSLWVGKGTKLAWEW